ncbi:cysteine desulfurase family protein [Bradyrhizobium sp. 2TAF24]|uniref:cysteine desulfurase family protein n=1 Tax=Bradyrhizobium sp. 2TAF24 TaxID=3233011 RepID=UPI003F8F07C4
MTERPVYLDNMASTPVDPRVVEAMAPFWSTAFGNPHSVEHAFGWQADEAVERAAASVAALIGADADEIIFTAGATEANNLAILGLAHRAPAGRRRMLVSAVEHKSVLAAARAAAGRYGTIVEVIPVDAEGRIDLDRLAGMISEDVICVVAMAVNNEIGTVQDIPAVAAICATADVHLVCDAVQAPLGVDLDVDRCKIPLLVLSAHKIYGPKGIGALYVRRDVQNMIEPQVYGGGQQRGLRAGTLPTPLCVGFGTAAELLGTEEAIGERAMIASLRDHFEDGLRRLGHPVVINGGGASRHPGNSNVRFRGRDGRDLIAALQPRFAVSSGSACSSGIVEPSHVLRAIGLTGEEANSSVRFSFGRFTTEADVAAAMEALSDAIFSDEAA